MSDQDVKEFKCESGRRLDEFLQEEGYRNFKIKVLLQCKKIWIHRNGRDFQARSMRMQLEKNDKVKLPSPNTDRWPAICQQELREIPDTDFRNIAFCPIYEPDPTLPYFRKMMNSRKSTIVQITPTTDPGVVTLRDFIGILATSRTIQAPIRNLILGSHAAEGVLGLQMDTGSGGLELTISYEDLLEALETTPQGSPKDSRILFINRDVFTPRPQAPEDKIPFLHIKGCNVGADDYLPYLRLLKKALGGVLEITAPKYSYKLLRYTGRNPGILEYMAYEFKLYRPEKIKDYTSLIEEFMKQSKLTPHRFQLIDGQRVRVEQWQKWIKKKEKIQNFLPGSNGEAAWDSPPLITAFGDRPLKNVIEFRYGTRYLFAEKQEFQGKAVKTIKLGSYDSRTLKVKDVMKETFLKKIVKAWLIEGLSNYEGDHVMKMWPDYSSFKEGHPFPGYIRFGYNTMDEFMDGWNWMFVWNNERKHLSFHPVRYEYTLSQPILAPQRRIYSNFYLDDGSIAKWPIEFQLIETDKRFFANTSG